jgi:ABC-type uncharacterized transport system substrate-binding protein
MVFFGLFVLESSQSLAQEKSRLKIMLIAWADVGIQEKVFLSELEKLGYQVQPEYFAAKLDRNALATFLRTTFESKVLGFDYVYTFGTTASLMAQSIIKNRVPHLSHSVNDPIGSGLVSSLKTTGVNINGLTDGVSVAAQLSLMRQILPFFRFSGWAKRQIISSDKSEASVNARKPLFLLINLF